jgi:hypothetical protein
MPAYFLLLFILNFSSPQHKEPKFEPQVVDNNVAIGYGIAIGDVDGDRKPDILLADKKQFVWYRNGDWKRFVMVENLTESDNVCIAARDINGDGQVEVAVGAQWNPSETTDTLKSGSVHFLIRPKDPTQQWTPVKLHHEPTVHRMRWVKAEENKFHLIVLPLHGRGNKNGEGEPVKVIAYEVPKNPAEQWSYKVIDGSMHLTHNLDIISKGESELIYVGGKEGIKILSFEKGKWSSSSWLITGESFGEIRAANVAMNSFVAGVQPMHGNILSVYHGDKNPVRRVLTSTLNQGHALAVADLLEKGSNEIVVGWREPNEEKKTGIKIFVSNATQPNDWKDSWIDDNGIACEDLQIEDLNGDGKKDIVASGRATHNLKIYWNKSF